MKRHVILFLAADPHTSNQLRLAEECAEIQRELKMVPYRDDLHFEARWAVSINDLMRHLNELAPTVIHFSGHGASSRLGSGSSGLHRDVESNDAGGGIYLQDEQGRPQLVPARALAMMVNAAASDTRVVLLNACYTTAQADVLRSKIECVVGMDGAIGDDAARAFSVAFYRALGYGRSIGNSVAQANAALAGLQFPDSALPICQTRNGIDADRVVLSPPGVLPSHAPPPSAPAQDVGRSFSSARKFLSAIGTGSESVTDDDIFAASLVHYRTVARATKDFKEAILARLLEWVDNHTFHTFVADDDWQSKLAKYAPDSELYVSIAVRGRFENEKCKLEIGLWWQHDNDSKVAIYAGLHDLPWGKKVKPTRNHTRRDVTSTAYLLRDATTPPDPDSLLEELEGAARIARST